MPVPILDEVPKSSFITQGDAIKFQDAHPATATIV
jgi:hypothetical protein